MKKIYKFYILIILCWIMTGLTNYAEAATYYAVATGNWTGSVWSTGIGGTGAAVSITSDDDVILYSEFTITVNVDATCKSVNFAFPSNGKEAVLNIGDSKLTTGAVNVTAEAGNRKATIRINTGTLNCTDFNFQGTVANASFIFDGAGVLNISGNVSGTGGTFTAGSGTVNYTGTSAQTVAARTYNNLTLSNSGLKTFTGAVTAANLTIKPEASATINTNVTVTVNTAFLIESSATATGSLIVNGTGSLAGAGTKSVERFIPVGGDDWHIISSPVGTIDLYTFAAGNEVNLGAGYDLAPYAEKVTGQTYGDWGPYVSATGASFAFGKGYAMRRELSLTNNYVIFTGNSIQTTDVTGISFTANANGWNALGNPYTSAINIGTFLSTNSTQVANSPYNSVYIWNPTGAGTSGAYEAVLTGNVAVGQGFMAKSKVPAGSVSFTTAMKVHNNTIAFKSAEIPMSEIRLKVVAPNGLLYNTLVKLGEEMTNGLDNCQDIGIFKGNPDIALYTRMPGDAQYDLQDQALPLPGETALRIPVGFDYVPGGEVTFSLTTENFSEGLQVYLEDTNNGKITLLSGENLSYTTSLPAKTSGAGRFNLVLQKSGTVGVAVNKTQNEFSVYTSNREIVINGPADSNTSFELYSIDGKCWHKSKASNNSINRIDGAGYPAGIYLLKIGKKGSVQTSKLVLTGN